MKKKALTVIFHKSTNAIVGQVASLSWVRSAKLGLAEKSQTSKKKNGRATAEAGSDDGTNDLGEYMELLGRSEL